MGTFTCRVAGSTVTIIGEFDASSADRVTAELMGAELDDDVYVDLSAVTFVDSTALRALVIAHQELGNRRRVLHLCGPSEPVTRLLELTGLDTQLTVDT